MAGANFKGKKQISALLGSQAGFGMIDTIICASIVTILAFGFLNFSVVSVQSLNKIQNSSVCHDAAGSILTSIKSFDNQVSVRSWLPTRANPKLGRDAEEKGQDNKPGRSLGHYKQVSSLDEKLPLIVGGSDSNGFSVPGDPFCETNGRTAVCDTVDQLTVDADGFVDLTKLHNTQNVRNAATWAQSIFNQNTPSICSTGITLTRNQLENLIPQVMQLPEWIQSVDLTIKENGPGAILCDGTKSTSGVNSGRGFSILLNVKGTSAGSTCASSGRVDFGRDTSPSRLSVTITNKNGQVIPANSCSCRKTFAEVQAGGGCPEMNEVRVSVNSNEPGTLLLCRKSSDPEGKFKSCGEAATDNPNVSFDPDVRSLATFNKPIQTVMTISNLANNEKFDMQFREVDVGGNIANAQMDFEVRMPSCPDPATYCSNEAPPVDGCGGACPVGTKNCAAQSSLFNIVYPAPNQNLTVHVSGTFATVGFEPVNGVFDLTDITCTDEASNTYRVSNEEYYVERTGGYACHFFFGVNYLGTHTVTVSATRGAVRESQSVTFSIDEKVPDFILTPRDGGTANYNSTTPYKEVFIQFVYGGPPLGIDHVSYKLNGVEFARGTGAFPYDVIKWDIKDVPDGAHTLTATLLTRAGNTLTKTSQVMVSHERVFIDNIVTGSTWTGDKPFFAVTATTGMSTASVQLQVDGVNVGPPVDRMTCGTYCWYAIPLSSGTLSVGAHILTVIATDFSGGKLQSPPVVVNITR